MLTKLSQAFNISALTTALVLLFGISSVYAWTAPKLPPPDGNASAPINTSDTAQAKSGNFTSTGAISGWNLIAASTFQIASTAPAGYVLTTDGTGKASWRMSTGGAGGSGSGIGGMQIFTSTGTFTIPATTVKVTVIGGGSGGVYNTSGAGGGAGGTAVKLLTGLTVGNTLNISAIGAGGAFGNPSIAGGVTTVKSGTQTISTITANGGGAAGVGDGSYRSQDTPGTGGTASGGDLNIDGQGGGAGVIPGPGGGAMAGSGGSTILGGGGYGSRGLPSGNGKYGAGGGGSDTVGGGNGGAGVVIFEWIASTGGTGSTIPCNWNGWVTPTLTNPNGECANISYKCDGTNVVKMELPTSEISRCVKTTSINGNP